jgi:hypothetical protein
MMPTTENLTIEQLRRALEIAQQIDKLELQLAAALGNENDARGPSARPRSKRRRRSLSPEAREKIAAAQRARWAKARRQKR